MRNNSSRGNRCASLFVIVTMSLAVPASAFAQSLSGKWVGVDQVLDNGVAHKVLLELKQTGDQLTGTVKTLGYSEPITGKASGNHVELFASWSPDQPFVVGELVGKDLHIKSEGKSFVATPTTSSDEIPSVAYIEPPALHPVASNGLAKTPPMGWNSWNLFAGKVDDRTVRTIADAMVTSGLRDAGYIYVNIDDTWEGVRDRSGVLQPNHKFPDMKALADYVHSKGLKLGIYSSPGPQTCAGYPGSYGHEVQDAKTWASWGIDYLKYDWCSAGAVYKNESLQPVYQKMGEALQRSGRPIVFSLCEYGLGGVEKWGPEVGGNLWRTTGDIRDEWSSMIEDAEKQMPTAPFAGPGHWNDPDMLEIGNGHMSEDEYRTHMSLWSLLASPLLAGNDVRSMSASTKAILLNKEVIAIDQDALGKQATRVSKDGDMETWVKPLADGGAAIGLFNHGSAPAQGKIVLSALKLGEGSPQARDLWAHQDVTFSDGVYSATVPTHGVLMVRLGK